MNIEQWNMEYSPPFHWSMMIFLGGARINSKDSWVTYYIFCKDNIDCYTIAYVGVIPNQVFDKFCNTFSSSYS